MYSWREQEEGLGREESGGIRMCLWVHPAVHLPAHGTRHSCRVRRRLYWGERIKGVDGAVLSSTKAPHSR